LGKKESWEHIDKVHVFKFKMILRFSQKIRMNEFISGHARTIHLPNLLFRIPKKSKTMKRKKHEDIRSSGTFFDGLCFDIEID
jgi:hypothetical protein